MLSTKDLFIALSNCKKGSNIHMYYTTLSGEDLYLEKKFLCVPKKVKVCSNPILIEKMTQHFKDISSIEMV